MIRVYHTSDLHDHRGFARRLASLREAAPGFLFDCGDSLRGSQTVYRRSEPIIDEIDAANYDVQAIGNREFHYLFPLVTARANKMRYPLLCSNLVDTKGRTLPFARSLVFEHEDARIHVLGLLIMQYPEGSPWERVFGWRFLQPWDVVAEYASRLGDRDVLVVLSHLGLSLDRKLAKAVGRTTLILGGHSHDTLFEPELVNGVPIIHAGPYGQYVSHTELQHDPATNRFSIEKFALLPLLGAP